MLSHLPILNAVAPAPLPTVQALQRLWESVAHKPLWAPPHFWRYLKLRRQMRLTLLDPQRVRVAAPEGKFNDCGSCTDLCCVGPHSTVLLRLQDIATLHDLGRTDLFTLQKPSFAAPALAQRPALRRQINSAAWRVFPVLRQDSMRACAALNRDGKCTLYPHWPLACARFPYALHLDDMEVFYSRRCQSFWIHPSGRERATPMAMAAVAAYNERIKDAVLLAYARQGLDGLGLLKYLNTDCL